MREQFKRRAGIVGVALFALVASVALAATTSTEANNDEGGESETTFTPLAAQIEIDRAREEDRAQRRAEDDALLQAIEDSRRQHEEEQRAAFLAYMEAELYAPDEAQAAPEPEEEFWNNPDSLIKSRDWSAEEDTILLQIAMAEAEGEGVEGKALVMCVVLNRVWSAGFPNSIEAVVFQKNQFSPVAPGGRYYTVTPDAECYEALDMIKRGWDESEGATFFEAYYNSSTWHRDNLQRLFQYGNHIFYKVP